MSKQRKKHKKHTVSVANILNANTDAQFRAFVEEHNAAVEAAADEEIQPDEAFAERYLAKMRRALGVAE